MKALITGILGQDGSYLAEFLHNKGYDVHGIVRRTSTKNPRHSAVEEVATLHTGDMTDTASIERIIEDVQPDEIYNLAAQSHVGESFKLVEQTTNVNYLGFLRVMEAARKFCPRTKVYQASTSEMFGHSKTNLQDENTELSARSPYGVSKIAAHHAAKYYRESYNMFVCCGILFNHESPRRGEEFVTRKIAISAAKKEKISMGSLHPKRDWGYAPDFVRAMWMMLQQEEPDDYVIATGETHTVQELLDLAYRSMGLNWENYYEINEKYVRPAEVNLLCGDATKAREKLGWEPSVTFRELVHLMVEAECE